MVKAHCELRGGKSTGPEERGVIGRVASAGATAQHHTGSTRCMRSYTGALKSLHAREIERITCHLRKSVALKQTYENLARGGGYFERIFLHLQTNRSNHYK